MSAERNVERTLQVPPGRIVGQVFTADSKQPVPNASVRVLDGDIIVDAKKTNNKGMFNSRLLFAGRYRIEVDNGGMRGAIDDVEVRLDEITRVEIPVS